MELTRDDLAAWYTVKRSRAVERVRDYAAHECPLVPAAEIEAVCAALGAVPGVHEAFDALDQRQRELVGSQPPS